MFLLLVKLRHVKHGPELVCSSSVDQKPPQTWWWSSSRISGPGCDNLCEVPWVPDYFWDKSSWEKWSCFQSGSRDLNGEPGHGHDWCGSASSCCGDILCSLFMYFRSLRVTEETSSFVTCSGNTRTWYQRLTGLRRTRLQVRTITSCCVCSGFSSRRIFIESSLSSTSETIVTPSKPVCWSGSSCLCGSASLWPSGTWVWISPVSLRWLWIKLILDHS